MVAERKSQKLTPGRKKQEDFNKVGQKFAVFPMIAWACFPQAPMPC